MKSNNDMLAFSCMKNLNLSSGFILLQEYHVSICLITFTWQEKVFRTTVTELKILIKPVKHWFDSVKPVYQNEFVNYLVMKCSISNS